MLRRFQSANSHADAAVASEKLLVRAGTARRSNRQRHTWIRPSPNWWTAALRRSTRSRSCRPPWGNDPNFATTVATQIGQKVDKVAGKGLSTEDYTSEEKAKLAGVAAGANNYQHPATHPASVIVQDSTHRFVTDSEKTTWNGKASTTVATQSANGLMSAADKKKLDDLTGGELVIQCSIPGMN